MMVTTSLKLETKYCEYRNHTRFARWLSRQLVVVYKLYRIFRRRKHGLMLGTHEIAGVE